MLRCNYTSVYKHELAYSLVVSSAIYLFVLLLCFLDSVARTCTHRWSWAEHPLLRPALDSTIPRDHQQTAAESRTHHGKNACTGFMSFLRPLCAVIIHDFTRSTFPNTLRLYGVRYFSSRGNVRGWSLVSEDPVHKSGTVIVNNYNCWTVHCYRNSCPLLSGRVGRLICLTAFPGTFYHVRSHVLFMGAYRTFFQCCTSGCHLARLVKYFRFSSQM